MNYIKSFIPYSVTLLLNVHLETSMISAMTFQVNLKALKYRNCFSRTSYFGLKGSLQFRLVTVFLKTVLQYEIQMIQFDGFVKRIKNIFFKNQIFFLFSESVSYKRFKAFKAFLIRSFCVIMYSRC